MLSLVSSESLPADTVRVRTTNSHASVRTTNSHMNECAHAPMHPCTHAPTHPCTHAHMHTCTHAHMHARTCVRLRNACLHSHAPAHAHTHTHTHTSLSDAEVLRDSADRSKEVWGLDGEGRGGPWIVNQCVEEGGRGTELGGDMCLARDINCKEIGAGTCEWGMYEEGLCEVTRLRRRVEMLEMEASKDAREKRGE